jgi:hypothetical protein
MLYLCVGFGRARNNRHFPCIQLVRRQLLRDFAEFLKICPWECEVFNL